LAAHDWRNPKSALNRILFVDRVILSQVEISALSALAFWERTNLIPDRAASAASDAAALWSIYEKNSPLSVDLPQKLHIME